MRVRDRRVRIIKNEKVAERLKIEKDWVSLILRKCGCARENVKKNYERTEKAE